ncbi:MAG: hypothetical protein WCI18_02230 [Pseudomonadota bacterium]
MRESPYHILIFSFCLGFATSALAQRLVIESPSQGPVTKVIYGKITEKSIFIFENEFPLIRDEAASKTVNAPIEYEANQAAKATSREPTATQGSRRTVLTSFVIPQDEVVRCMNSPRFMGFKSLVVALKEKINSVVINRGSDSGSCPDKIAATLSKTLPDLNIAVESSGDDGIKIYLGAVSVGNLTKPAALAASADTGEAPLLRSLADVVKWAHITVGEQNIIPEANGWFVIEVAKQMEYQVEMVVPGYKPLTSKVYALLVSADVSQVTKGQGYSTRSAEFNKPALAIKVTETPYLAKKTIIDGGLGGGYGFGREVPGEKKGQRTVALFGLERREWYDAFGCRAGLFYSRAPATVVPSTYTVRTSGFYDGSMLEDELFFRVGAGFEWFHAKLTEPKEKVITESDLPTANIPQQVLSPMFTLSMHTILFDRLIVSPSLVVTPLYIASIGFYTSKSPGLEVSAKVFKNWILALQVGTEVHRYPSQLGETRLLLDYGLLTLKRGVF